jgi:hypothetical protein
MARGQFSGEKVSKMEAVRQSLNELGADAKPLQIKDHLKSRFGISMEPNMISNYKSMIKSGGSKSSLIRRPRGRPAGSGSGSGTRSGFSIEEIQAVKEVADRIGVEKVLKLAAVL